MSQQQLLQEFDKINTDNMSNDQLIKTYRKFLTEYNNHSVMRPEQKHTEVINNPVSGMNYLGIGTEFVNWKDLTPIMNAEGWSKWKYPLTKEEQQRKANDNDRNREESFYSNEYLGLYQDYKKELINAINSKTSFSPHNAPVYASGMPGLITDKNHPELRINNSISELINFTIRQNPLTQLIPSAPSQTLQEKILELEGFEVFGNAVDGAVAPPQVGKLTETKFDIGQDIGSIGITLKGSIVYANAPFNIEEVYTRHMSEKFQLVKNTRIMSETFSKFSNSSASAETFDTRSTVGISDKDPHKTFNNIIIELQEAGGQSMDGQLSICLSNLLVFNALQSNDHFPRDVGSMPMGNGIFNITAYSSPFKWGVTDLIPKTDKYFYALTDKAAKLWNGITRMYEITQLNGTKVKHTIQFNSSHAIKTGYGKKVNGAIA